MGLMDREHPVESIYSVVVLDLPFLETSLSLSLSLSLSPTFSPSLSLSLTHIRLFSICKQRR